MKRIFALFLSLAGLFSCLAVTAGAMFDPSPVYEVQAKSAYIVNTDTNIIVYDKDSQKQVPPGGLPNYQPIARGRPHSADPHATPTRPRWAWRTSFPAET